MSQEIIAVSKEDIIKAFENAGMSVKAIDALKFELNETPLRGRITKFVDEPKEFTPKGGILTKYFVFEVSDENDRVIGTVAINRLFDTFVKDNDYIVTSKDAKNPNKGMLRSHKMNNLSNFGSSRAEQISRLIGTMYEAKRVEKKVIASYETADLFVPANVKGEVTDQNVAKLNKNTAPKELIEFTFVAE